MTNINNNFKKGTDLFYRKVASHMESVKKVDREKDARHRKAINDWFYGKIESQEPLGEKFDKVLFDNLWDLYDKK